jgi:uncharacterized membrane protein (UPF0127 family)
MPDGPRQGPQAPAGREVVVRPMHGGDGARLWALCLLAALALLIGVGAAAAQTLEPLAIDSAEQRFEFQVEVAATPAERSQGLMYRRHLPDEHGMLFDFGSTGPASMWMRNTYIPLDMLFIEPDGRIRKIAAETEPLSEEVISSDGPVRAVLELRGGITDELGIEPGDRIIHPLFPEDGS